MRPGAALLLLAALAVAVVCARLGLWQLARAGEKRSAHAASTTLFDLPPLEPGGTLPAEPPSAGRRVRLAGRWDGARHVLLSGRGHLATAGVLVVTPLVLDSGARVLVERGWLEAADSRTAHPERLADSTASVTGIVTALAPRTGANAWVALPAERAGVALWSARTLDSAGVATHVPAPVAAWYVRALPAAAHAATPGEPIPVAAREQASGASVHVAYAIQWFVIGALLPAGALALALRRRRAARG